MNIIQCAQCKTADLNTTMYFSKDSAPIGEWPLYYLGSGPHNPQDATAYFCGVECANLYHKEHHNAT